MNTTDERATVREGSKKPKVILFILLFIAVLLTAFTAYLRNSDINIDENYIKKLFYDTLHKKGVDEEDIKLWEIEYEAKERPDFAVYKDLLVKCTIYGITAMDKKGNKQWSITVKMNEPMLKTKGQNLLVADIGGRQAFVMDTKGLKWEETFEGDIINADINQKGFITVVHELEKYKGIVKVFSPEGQEIFRRSIIDTFVFSSEVLPSGETVIIHSIDVSGMSAASYIEFTDLLGNPFAALSPCENHVYPFVWALEDDSFAIVNDTSIIYFDKNRSEVWKKEYKRVYSTGVIDDRVFIAAVSSVEGANACKIVLINKAGNIVKDYQLGEEVYNISTYHDTAAINTGREVHFVNGRGDLIVKYSSISDVEEVHFFSKNEAAVVTKNSVDIVRIR
ncbi:MAG: hypothetical protein HPY74_04910 [Firmicutes bacterium]|nr:hypothetical protein [Bacillota bacterium]